jgi:hypothetical protein
MSRREADIPALYERHREALLLFFVRRTTDVEVALDLWAETLPKRWPPAAAIAGEVTARRRRGSTGSLAAS